LALRAAARGIGAMRFGGRKSPLWIGLLAFVFVLGVASPAGGADLTRTYLNAYNDTCAFGTAHAEALRRHQVLLVPGYLSDLNPDHFADHMRWLGALGVEHKKVAVRSGHSSEINSAVIAAAIKSSAKPVILITHSKGAIDTLEALLSEPLLRGKVAGWISLQGPFFGSPVADKLLDGSLINPIIATVILGFFGGTRESAQGLTTGASGSYYRGRATAITQLLRDVPAVAFASIIESAPGASANTALSIPHDMLARDGIRSDGLVPLDSAVLPGMDFVKVSGVDHIAPVTSAQQPFDRVRMTQALLLALGAPFPLRGLPRDAGCKMPG
jgi:hypothetical protein